MINPKILLIDNYDSFTYNLSDLLIQAGANVTVRRNDEDFIEAVAAGEFDAVVIGPGPGNPSDGSYFGKNNQIITQFGGKGLPILGVCLGFQGIAVAFGAKLKKANSPMHGKTSFLEITSHDDLFSDVPNGVEVMRYHSLMIDTDSDLPQELSISAEVKNTADSVKSNGREIMAIRHKNLPIFGVQFHPESFATEAGKQMIKNFLEQIS